MPELEISILNPYDPHEFCKTITFSGLDGTQSEIRQVFFLGWNLRREIAADAKRIRSTIEFSPRQPTWVFSKKCRR